MNKSAFCVLILMIIAAAVFTGLIFKQNMWLLICGYWLVLTVKNFIDLKGGKQ